MSSENIRQALSALRANWGRSLLTMLIIAFGIMAVVGILTAIDAAIYSLADNFSTLGANSISIEERNSRRQGRRNGRSEKRAEAITYDQALAFENMFGAQATVAVEMRATGSAVVKYGEEETNPTIDVRGVDEDYLDVKSFEVELGRTINKREARQGANVALVGVDVVSALFDGKPERAMGRVITVGPMRLEVVGTLLSKGSSMSDGADGMVLVPLQTSRRAYATPNTRYNMFAKLPSGANVNAGVSEATGAMRIARGLSAKQDNDFTIETSDSLLQELEDNTAKLQIGAIAIGIMTLFGAAIGLMNIMLVSVTERTREIGIAKALGASRGSILYQFLTEAVVVTQLGGVFGIVAGMMLGNLVALYFEGSFIIPWGWIIASFIVCLLTGLVAGLYPAIKASRLDPIESLRYE